MEVVRPAGCAARAARHGVGARRRPGGSGHGIDVGIDRRSPVDWDIYERFGPFCYTGSLDAVEVVPGDPAPDSPQTMVDLIREMGARFE